MVVPDTLTGAPPSASDSAFSASPRRGAIRGRTREHACAEFDARPVVVDECRRSVDRRDAADLRIREQRREPVPLLRAVGRLSQCARPERTDAGRRQEFLHGD